jgi:hypothetical protein
VTSRETEKQMFSTFVLGNKSTKRDLVSSLSLRFARVEPQNR